LPSVLVLMHATELIFLLNNHSLEHNV
jgi:hypothetical protein